MIRLSLAALATAAVLLAGCGSSSKKNTTTTLPAASTPATTAKSAPSSGGCRHVAAPAAKHVNLPAPKTRLTATAPHVVTLQTSCGTIKIALDVKRDPKTASSFAYLVRRGVFDGLTFHRVVPGYVIQGGDPQGTGQGGPGYSVVEAPPRNQAYTRGVVAMAKTQTEAPGTSGSQFFIVIGADTGLPAEYAVAGKVTSGLPVADAIGAIPPTTGQDGPPSQTVVIEKATLGSK